MSHGPWNKGSGFKLGELISHKHGENLTIGLSFVVMKGREQ